MKSLSARHAVCLVAAAAALVLTDPGAVASSPGRPRTPVASVGPLINAADRDAPPARTSRPAGPVPRGVPGSWKLQFQDNFSGTALDYDKWRPNWMGADDETPTKNFNQREKSCYDPAQVSVSHGKLLLKAEKRACRASTGEMYEYASGVIQSSHDYTFTYGYAEARMYLPRNTAPDLGAVGSCGPNWAAFWLNADPWPQSGEIDVMECLGKDNVSWNYHWAAGKVSRSPSEWKGRMPGTSGWHTFGADWQPKSITFYYDGKMVGRQTTGVTAKPHYIIANLSISGTKIKAPQTIKVDYIRVWKRKGASATG